jgi:hypothetical protein
VFEDDIDKAQEELAQKYRERYGLVKNNPISNERMLEYLNTGYTGGLSEAQSEWLIQKEFVSMRMDIVKGRALSPNQAQELIDQVNTAPLDQLFSGGVFTEELANVLSARQELVFNKRDIRLSEEEIKELEGEIQKQVRRTRQELIQDEVRGSVGGFMRRGINSAAMYGRLAAGVGGLVGYDVNQGPMGELFEDHLAGNINTARTAGEKLLANQMCSENNPPKAETAVFSPSGQPVAFISARASQVLETNQYDYIIEYAFKPAIPRDGQATIRVTGNNQNSIHTFSTAENSIRTGPRALGLTGARETTMCITFSESLEKYFGQNAIGEGLGRNKLCTEVKINE